MNGKWRMVAFLMLGGAAWASPVPPPPPGFKGQQYIDSQGCVFTQADGKWSPRLDSSGQLLCGFPPSLDARRQDAAADRVLPLAEAPQPDAETLLIEQLSRDLRAGEWTHDPKPAETRAEPTPSRRPNALQGTLQDAVGVAPALRTASGVQLPPEACERLGYRPAAAGVDPGALTLGLCPGMSMSPSVAALAPVVPAVPSAVRPSPQGKAAGAVPAPRPAVAPESKPARQVATKPRPAQAPAKTPSASAVRVVPAKPEAPAREMIPPSARYVQVGAFADGENALIVLRRLSERGYPTGQARARQADKGMRVIMAGPFPDRQKLIEALNDLRANGYPGAVAR